MKNPTPAIVLIQLIVVACVFAQVVTVSWIVRSNGVVVSNVPSRVLWSDRWPPDWQVAAETTNSSVTFRSTNPVAVFTVEQKTNVTENNLLTPKLP